LTLTEKDNSAVQKLHPHLTNYPKARAIYTVSLALMMAVGRGQIIEILCDALWRDFSCAKRVRERRSNTQSRLAWGRLRRSHFGIHRSPASESSGCNYIDVEVAGQPFKPKYRWLSSVLWNKLGKL
jgi:hypothetical protein